MSPPALKYLVSLLANITQRMSEVSPLIMCSNSCNTAKERAFTGGWSSSTRSVWSCLETLKYPIMNSKDYGCLNVLLKLGGLIDMLNAFPKFFYYRHVVCGRVTLKKQVKGKPLKG